MNIEDQKTKIAVFMLETIPDALFVRISDKITAELADDFELRLDQLSHISSRLSTKAVTLRPSKTLYNNEADFAEINGVALEISDWTFMVEEDQ